MKRTRARLTAAVPLALLTIALVGCTTDGSGDGGNGNGGSAITVDAHGVDCAAPGEASDAIGVDGEFGQFLLLDAEVPVTVEETERTVMLEGRGDAPYQAGEVAHATVTIYNGVNGELINVLPDTPVPNDAEQLVGADWVYEAVRCGSDGQRVSIVMPAGEALSGDPADAGFADVAAEDPFIFVVDFRDQFLGCETLDPRDEQYPNVQIGSDIAEPFIEIPECMEPPTELEIEVLVEGDGREVGPDENIMTNYVGVLWNGAERFDGSWSETGVEFSTAEGALIQGFTEAMVGQRIGSTILVTMPPELGYSDRLTRTFVLQLIGDAE